MRSVMGSDAIALIQFGVSLTGSNPWADLTVNRGFFFIIPHSEMCLLKKRSKVKSQHSKYRLSLPVLPCGDEVLLVDHPHGVGGGARAVEDELRLFHDLPHADGAVSAARGHRASGRIAIRSEWLASFTRAQPPHHTGVLWRDRSAASGGCGRGAWRGAGAGVRYLAGWS